MEIVVGGPMEQCRRPSGWLGRFVLWNMNGRHSKVTDWGMGHVAIKESDIVLDVGCGGGRTVSKLAAMVPNGKVYGVDHSQAAATFAAKSNRKWVAAGRVEIREGSVSELPFYDATFNLVTAVETHFWWPDIAVGLREIRRTLRPGGTLVIIAEVYRGSEAKSAKLIEQHLPKSGMKLLTVDEHYELLAQAGYTGAKVTVDSSKGWICCRGEEVLSRPASGAATRRLRREPILLQNRQNKPRR